jgi:hypothetical protein
MLVESAEFPASSKTKPLIVNVSALVGSPEAVKGANNAKQKTANRKEAETFFDIETI